MSLNTKEPFFQDGLFRPATGLFPHSSLFWLPKLLARTELSSEAVKESAAEASFASEVVIIKQPDIRTGLLLKRAVAKELKNAAFCPLDVPV